ncbi:MAG TPA: peptide ABC transporter permease, partial [Desulfobacteraceae bacterium]|nr:peptide ABC transporter permease [Desulfobacteraceae bacterium]
MRWTEATAENIFALFPGTDPDLRDELLIIEAFYDSSSFIPGHAPGADEALSIAGLLELADDLAVNPPQRPFLLIATSGHGQSLAGMRETIWTANVRSKDLRAMEKQLKADAGEREKFIDLLEQYRQGSADDAGGLMLQKAIDHALKLQVDDLSTELMRLRMYEDKDSSSVTIKKLAGQRFILRRLGWKTSFADLTAEEKQLLDPLVSRSITEHQAVLNEVRSQQVILKSVKRLRSLIVEYEPRAVVSLHLSSHGTGLGAFHQGFLYPLRPTINRTAAFRDIEQALQDSAELLPATAPAFISTLRPNRLQPWEDLLPDRPALGGEVSSLAGLPGLTLATTSDIRQHWSTPFDTLDRIDWNYAARQWRLARQLISGLDQAATLEKGYIRNGFSTVEGNSSLLLHGELFPEHPAPNTVILAFQGLSRYHFMTDRQGRFLLKGVADKKHVLDKVILEGYLFSEQDGSVIWAIDKRLTGKSSYRVKMQRNEMKTDLIMFQCRQTTIFNLLEPRSFRYMTKLELIDGRREAPPVRYWYSRIDTRTSTLASIYLEPDTPLKLTLSDSVLHKKMIMTNGDSDDPMGKGYNISRHPSLYHTTYLTARDMWALLGPRISNLEEHGIQNDRIQTLRLQGEQALQLAEKALKDQHYSLFFEESNKAWALASRVYDHVEKTQKDVLFGVLFYIALFVPFAFCLERLFFGFVSIYKRIAGFTVILLFLILIIAQVHPAFE